MNLRRQFLCGHEGFVVGDELSSQKISLPSDQLDRLQKTFLQKQDSTAACGFTSMFNPFRGTSSGSTWHRVTAAVLHTNNGPVSSSQQPNQLLGQPSFPGNGMVVDPFESLRPGPICIAKTLAQ